MASLRLSLLGPFEAAVGERPLSRFRSNKVQALLIYLATEAGVAHRRDALMALLWPGLPQRSAQVNLRQTLYLLRQASPELTTRDGGDAVPFLLSDRHTAQINPAADVQLDVTAFASLLDDGPTDRGATQRLEQAVALYRGDFLCDFYLPDSEAFEDWAAAVRAGLRQAVLQALETLTNHHIEQGSYTQAQTHARRALAIDNLRESAHRGLMMALALDGQRSAALRQYAECEEVLQEELGVNPAEETTQLYQAIKEKQHPPPPQDGIPSLSPTTAVHDRYRLETEIGRGGMSVVYRARDTLLERDVAVKVMSAAGLGTEGRTRLLQEAQSAARLNHPNIVTVHDVEEADGSPFIVMELVEGESLYDLKVAGDRRLGALDEVVTIACQICAALEHAHAHGIIHRDLKPENVMITAGGAVKLMDFGLARSMASRLTSEGTIAGTVFYLAPELALGGEFDGRADLYALGVMLYELTTGRLPFAADDPIAVISQHLHAPVVPPRAKNEQIPPALDALIVRLLSKAPADRPASASEVLRMLEQPSILDREAVPAQELSVLERIKRGRMVGRERELREARVLWNQALSGQGCMLLISGEPGVGKTRLVRELITQAEVSAGRALVGASYAEGGAPYAAFGQIIRQVLRGDSEADFDLPEPVLADLLTLAPELRLRYPNVPANPLLDDPQAEQHRLFQNLLIFFTALSDRAPLLLVLEDVHWADSGTLSLLRHLARHTRQGRVMIVATYREVELDQARPFHEVLLDLNRERLATRLKLPRLDRGGTEELLGVLFDEEITPEFLDGIYRETEGNPFFVEEVCKALVESRELWYADGRWDRLSMEELGIPQSVRVAIQSRVRPLPVEAQEMLCLAAILGREFDLDTLAQASDQSKDTLIDALESAERAQLIEELSGERGGTFAFAHALFASTLVEGLRTMQRRRLHRRAAAAVEALYPDDGSRLEALAHHYEQAGDAEKAADYLLKAGDRAREIYASEEAVDHYRQVLALLDEPSLRHSRKDWRLEALKGLGRVYVGTDKVAEAEACFQEAIALGHEIGLAPRELVQLYHWLCEALYWQSRYDDLIRIGEEGLALLGDDTECVEAVLMNQFIGAGHFEKGNPKPYQEFAYRTAGFIQRLPYSRELRPVYVNIAVPLMLAKDIEEAIKWLQALEERASQHHDLRTLAETYFMQGVAFGVRGDLHGAIPRLQQGLELFIRIGDVPHASRALIAMGGVSLSLGDLQKAEAYADRAIEASQAVESKQDDLAWGYRLCGQTHLCRGDWEKATGAFKKAIRVFQGTNQRWFEAWATHLLGQAHLARTDRGKALRRFQETLALLESEELRGFPFQPYQAQFDVNPLVASVLSGLEEAHEDPEPFRTFCDRCRAQAGDGPFVQWYLEPADVGAIREQPLLREEFVETLPSDWVWQDPLDGCSFGVASRSANGVDTVRDGLEIHAARGRGLWFFNWSAPRMLRSVSGDWVAQTACVPASEAKPAIGGLVLWKDKKNYLRLDRGATGEHGILFTGCLGNRDILIGRGRLQSDASDRVFLRLERGGERVDALCSADGERWFTVGHVEFLVEDPVQVGMHAIGNIDRAVYRGAYPDGTAICFESFQLWE
jgi:DNA-binding SARP family transcriptional activator/Cdc6-like AAA superfamily ATPase/predicted Ser/Thr protein kinase